MIRTCKDCGTPLLYECLWPDGSVRCSKCHNKKLKSLDKIIERRRLNDVKVSQMWV